MARPSNVLRPVHLHTTIPEDLRARMDLHLYSDVEKRVPMGAYQQFICGLVKDFFDQARPAPSLKEVERTETDTGKHFAMQGLLTDIANTDLRSGWELDKVTQIVRQAREILGIRPKL